MANPVPQAGRVTLARGGILRADPEYPSVVGVFFHAPKSLVRYENGAPIFEEDGENRERRERRGNKNKNKDQLIDRGIYPSPSGRGGDPLSVSEMGG